MSTTTDLLTAFSYLVVNGAPRRPVFHYTTIESLFAGIISNKRNPGEEIIELECLFIKGNL